MGKELKGAKLIPLLLILFFTSLLSPLVYAVGESKAWNFERNDDGKYAFAVKITVSFDSSQWLIDETHEVDVSIVTRDVNQDVVKKIYVTLVYVYMLGDKIQQPIELLNETSSKQLYPPLNFAKTYRIDARVQRAKYLGVEGESFYAKLFFRIDLQLVQPLGRIVNFALSNEHTVYDPIWIRITSPLPWWRQYLPHIIGMLSICTIVILVYKYRKQRRS